MSQTTKISEKRLIAAKVEATAGTAVALTSAEGGFWVRNPKISPSIGYNPRSQGPSLSPAPGVAGAQMGKATFGIEVAGSGTTSLPTWASVFLEACAFSATGLVLTPCDPNLAPTLTIAIFEDGVRRQIAGAQGTVKFVADEVGKVVIAEFEFTGKYSDEADQGMLSPTFVSVLPPVFEGNIITFGAFAPVLAKLTVDMSNTVSLRQSAADSTGYAAALVTKRQPMVSADPELTSVATRNWISLLKANTMEAFSWQIGSASHNTITISAPNAKTRKSDRGERTGIMTDEVECELVSTSGAGNDEVVITFA